MTGDGLVTLGQIEAAAATLRGITTVTPLVPFGPASMIVKFDGVTEAGESGSLMNAAIRSSAACQSLRLPGGSASSNAASTFRGLRESRYSTFTPSLSAGKPISLAKEEMRSQTWMRRPMDASRMLRAPLSMRSTSPGT